MSNYSANAVPPQEHRRRQDLGIVANRTEPEEIPYSHWADLVRRIKTQETDGLEELYQFFSKGIRLYFCRCTGGQDLDDKLHDLFIIIVQAIRRGEIREPERLMGFVRTVARRQVTAHIEQVVHARKEEIDIESGHGIADSECGPEQEAIFVQREEWIQAVLSELSNRDREILVRFYLKEHTQARICSEMRLSETQFRLLKSRAKARFGDLGKKKLAGLALSAAVTRNGAGIKRSRQDLAS